MKNRTVRSGRFRKVFFLIGVYSAVAVVSILIVTVIPVLMNSAQQSVTPPPESTQTTFLYDSPKDAAATESPLIQRNFAQGSVFRADQTNETDTSRAYTPTNRIWSSIIFDGTIKGLFGYPWALKSNSTGLQLSLPQPRAVSDQTIIAETARGSINLSFTQPVARYVVQDWSDLTVTIAALSAEGGVVGQVIAVQGSPYLYIKPGDGRLIMNARTHTRGSTGLTVADGNMRYSVFNYANFTVSGSTYTIEGSDWLSIATYSSP